jgi:hypothetical protein
MPTFRTLPGFIREYDKLTPEQQAAFRRAVVHFVHDLRAGAFRKGLRVKKMSGQEDVWEMTWAPDGRATFEYGEPARDGEQHVIWRRVGSHDIFGRP